MVGVVALAVRTGRGRVVLGYVPRRVIWRAMRRGLGGSRGFYRKKKAGEKGHQSVRCGWAGFFRVLRSCYTIGLSLFWIKATGTLFSLSLYWKIQHSKINVPLDQC